jgi:hypothetical protein
MAQPDLGLQVLTHGADRSVHEQLTKKEFFNKRSGTFIQNLGCSSSKAINPQISATSSGKGLLSKSFIFSRTHPKCGSNEDSRQGNVLRNNQKDKEHPCLPDVGNGVHHGLVPLGPFFFIDNYSVLATIVDVAAVGGRVVNISFRRRSPEHKRPKLELHGA